MADATVTNLQYILKTKYDQKKLNIMTYADDPLLGLIRKDTNFGGNNARISLRYGSPQGGSLTFANASANTTSSSDVGFLLTRAKDYHISGITGEALLAGEGNENTILQSVKGEMDGATRMIKRSLEIGVYGNGGGARGQISAGSTVGNPTITLSDITQIVNFEVGMKVAASSADGTSGALRNAGATDTITACDRDAGTLTTTTAWTTGIAAVAASDYLFRDGDFGAHIKGLAAWLPTTAPSGGDSFFGVDRSVDTTRLAGVRFTGGGAPREQTAIKCLARLKREGGKPDILLMNLEEWAQLALSLGARATVDMVKSSDGIFGFDALKIVGPAGAVKVVGSINVPNGKFYMLQLDTWVLKSIKGCPHLDDSDGNKMLRNSASDGYSWRLRYYAQIGCEAPGFNAVGTW